MKICPGIPISFFTFLSIMTSLVNPAWAIDNVSGVWETSWEPLTLVQTGNTVEGKYPAMDNGEIFGTLKGNVLSGFWIEDEASEHCTKALRGRHYWGKFQMVFEDDQFSAEWGYCGDGDLKNSWNGNLAKNITDNDTSQKWVEHGMGDCSGHDVDTSEGSVPDAAKIKEGYTAVCWDGNKYSNRNSPGKAFCTYKNISTDACTGGSNVGVVYRTRDKKPCDGNAEASASESCARIKAEQENCGEGYIVDILPDNDANDSPCLDQIKVVRKRADLMTEQLLPATKDWSQAGFTYQLEFESGALASNVLVHLESNATVSSLLNLHGAGSDALPSNERWDSFYTDDEGIIRLFASLEPQDSEIRVEITDIGIVDKSGSYSRGYYLGDGDALNVLVPSLQVDYKKAKLHPIAPRFEHGEISVDYNISWLGRKFISQNFPRIFDDENLYIQLIDKNDNSSSNLISGTVDSYGLYSFYIPSVTIHRSYSVTLYLVDTPFIGYMNATNRPAENIAYRIPSSEIEVTIDQGPWDEISVDHAYVNYAGDSGCYADAVWRLVNTKSGNSVREGKFVEVDYGNESIHGSYTRKDGNLVVSWGCLPGSPYYGEAKIHTHTLEDELPWGVKQTDAYIYRGNGHPLKVVYPFPDFWQEDLPWDIPIAKLDKCQTRYTAYREGQAEWIFTLNDGASVPQGTEVAIKVNDDHFEYGKIGEGGKLVYKAHAPNGYKHTYKLSPQSFPSAEILYYGPAPAITLEFSSEHESGHLEEQSCP